MQSVIKLKLRVLDQVGVMADIATLLAASDLNIIAMEVAKNTDHSEVFLEVEAGRQSPDEAQILSNLGASAHVLSVRTISSMPHEKRQKRFQVVLDSISDGILAVDEDGELAIINRVARKMLDCHEGDIIGKNLRELKLPDSRILDCLQGKPYVNAKRNLIRGQERYQYLASGKIIHDARQRIVGAVEVMQDMKVIRELANAVVETPQSTFSDMIGHSPTIQNAIAFAEKIAATDGIVSIRGESGTGKELFASAIHVESGRSGLFIPINCAALPETLLESELFGYLGGAFSGAKKEGKAGLFETARDGTIFLDEIAEMPTSLQAKMLRVIQEGKVRRIGSSQETSANVRIITATNQNLEQLVEKGLFREDLYYRINVFPVHIPPLRERLEDIPLLAEHFLFQVNARLGKPKQTLTDGALDKLNCHHWPGNVREFRNVIERAAVFGGEGKIDINSIMLGCEFGKSMAETGVQTMDSGAGTLPQQVERFEQKIINEALKQSPSKRQAAIRLGISHTALLKKLKKHLRSVETNGTNGN